MVAAVLGISKWIVRSDNSIACNENRDCDLVLLQEKSYNAGGKSFQVKKWH